MKKNCQDLSKKIQKKGIASTNKKKKTHAKKINNSTIISKGKQLLVFSFIILIGVLFFLVIFSFLPDKQQEIYSGLTAAYFFPPFGKESIIFVGLNQGLPPVLWGISIWIYDFLTCIMLITCWWFIELLIKYIPAFSFIGIRKTKPHVYKTRVSLKIWYEKLHQKTYEIKAKRYGKVLPLALLMFMFIPFQGSGAVTTTILCTSLGLRTRETLTIVLIGSAFSVLFITLVSLGIIGIWI